MSHRTFRGGRTLLLAVGAAGIAIATTLPAWNGAHATQPPREGARWPVDPPTDRIRAFNYSHAYVSLVNRVRANRVAVRASAMTGSAAGTVGGVAITGSRDIPVLMDVYANTAATTDATGLAQATVTGQTASTPVRVPGLSLAGLLALVVGVAVFAHLSRGVGR